MAKKTWGIVLLCFFALLFVPSKAVAADSGVCGDHLTWEVNDAGTLTIQGTGDMYDFPTGSGYDSPRERPWKSCKFNTVIMNLIVSIFIKKYRETSLFYFKAYMKNFPLNILLPLRYSRKIGTGKNLLKV